MNFFPHAVKQPLLGMKVKGKEKKKIESSGNCQISKMSVHIGLKII